MARFEMMSKKEQEGVLTLLDTSNLSSLALAVEILDIWQVGTLIFDQFSKARPKVEYWKATTTVPDDRQEISCKEYHLRVADFASYKLNEEIYFYTITWEFGPVKLLRYYYSAYIYNHINSGRAYITMYRNPLYHPKNPRSRRRPIYHLFVLKYHIYGEIEVIRDVLDYRRVVTSIGDAIIESELNHN
jgi:hypothetical protein